MGQVIQFKYFFARLRPIGETRLENMLYVVYVIRSRQQTKRKQWTADNKLIVKYETNINMF